MHQGTEWKSEKVALRIYNRPSSVQELLSELTNVAATVHCSGGYYLILSFGEKACNLTMNVIMPRYHFVVENSKTNFSSSWQKYQKQKCKYFIGHWTGQYSMHRGEQRNQILIRLWQKYQRGALPCSKRMGSLKDTTLKISLRPEI